MSIIGEIALNFIEVRDKIKIYHWQTKSYGKHKASDGLVEKLTDNMDKFVEIMQGSRNERVVMPDRDIRLENQTDESIIILLNAFKKWLLLFIPSFLKANKSGATNESDLMNLRDEILGNVNQTLYLLSFR